MCILHAQSYAIPLAKWLVCPDAPGPIQLPQGLTKQIWQWKVGLLTEGVLWKGGEMARLESHLSR